ncbi:type 4a pilus biogenesis protein PilO [Vibrio sp. SM6]|uniref:Type 4a pilus biogenesis protein PilO n=1 Tax=Vibrio agarilyticus TaxID=2726741 RepID=A0A7X8TR65_9VIBR|nr:type 4a pilus biogenesis protein PilO [Vibrio agarilyticus]NLS13482.1 type 4a pilus biogenesis protein PilO [Vibrio agarilyticus]
MAEQQSFDWQELELDEMAYWPRQAQVAVFLVLFGLAQLLGFWFYLDPKLVLLEQQKHQERALKMILAEKANQAAALPKVQSQLDELNRRYSALLRQLPEQKELATLLAAVNEQGMRHNLTFTRIDWGEVEPLETLNRLPLNIELTGRYHDIGRFSEAIARLPRIITLNDVTWQRVSNESQMLHFRVDAHTYQFRAEPSRDSLSKKTKQQALPYGGEP